MRKLFGTDGIRGIAGEFPLDKETTFAIGHALAQHLNKKAQKPRVVVGQDTRESSGWIGDSVSAGLKTGGAEVASAGVITTPGIAYLARKQSFAAGVVISASHNPWTDNGIKVFGGDGYKLSDEIELAIEKEIFEKLAAGRELAVGQPSSTVDTLPGNHSLQEDYEKWLKARLSQTDLSGKHLVIDCANGAASRIAPEVFAMLEVKVDFTHHTPNGRNINENCGALHPEVVAAEVKRRGGDLGVTFDGDADRALFADQHGNVVNGDAVMLMMARDLKTRGELRGNTVVATTMSNMGLEAALKRSDIKMLRAPVGDKYVLEQMQKTGAVLGGEQSGHVIFSQIATTGDGVLTALMVLEVVARSGKPISDLVADLKVFPQVIKNVRVREKQPLQEIPAVRSCIAVAERDLKDKGRVVVRYSGTEALARVMIEAESKEKMEKHANAIAQAIQAAIGA
jgi:phosphoglucosamine mutase